MGIPVGWNIVRDEAKEKGVLHADLTGRSPIRRHVRARNDGHASRFASALEHASRLSHARTQRPPAPPVPELRDERALPSLTPGFAPAHPRDRRQRNDTPAEPASPEPVAEDRLTDLRLLRRFPGGPALEEGAPSPQPGRILSWTSGRRHAPYARTARRRASNPAASDDETPATTRAVSHPPLRRVGHRTIADGPLPSSSLRESWSPVSNLDGLGDRERSNSVSSTSSNLPWQTFLTTVVPDPVAPTAESSFASSAASASFAASSSRASSSNSNSAASERTQLTIPSTRASSGSRRREHLDLGRVSENFVRACESSDEGDSTASDTEDEVAANPLSRRRMRPSYFADGPPTPRSYGRRLRDASDGARSYVRNFYSGSYPPAAERDYEDPRAHDARVDEPVDGPVDSPPRDQEADSFATVSDEAQAESPASPLDQELRDARSLLERLTRRGDIGDDFWASVGLTRSFTDGIERVQERGRY
ncbi:hypothetical protein E8E12_001210 [Didymella heteroderae]|uniref:Uncharacterized protein n=1 Tax=Didymella heteroderae TaxID=1769908 RepID=A0A9P4WG82_9PLEO|nr:hypothetical protein E8E12_001210 [Didymella heteroderae]